MSTYPDLYLYIHGEWRKTADDIPVLNPATEKEIGRLPHARISDLDDALDEVAPSTRATAPRPVADPQTPPPPPGDGGGESPDAAPADMPPAGATAFA